MMKLVVEEVPEDPARGGTPDFEAADLEAIEDIGDMFPEEVEHPEPDAAHEEKEVAEPVVEENGNGEEGIGSASSDESSTESTLDEELFHAQESSVVESGIQKQVEGNLLQNRRSKMLHVVNLDAETGSDFTAVCGVHGDGFIHLPEGSTFLWPKCMKCFKEDSERTGLVNVLSAAKKRRM